MKYVPSLPPPAGGMQGRSGLTPVNPVKPAQLAIQPYREAAVELEREAVAQPVREAAMEPVLEKDRREPAQEPRRKYCRRVAHQPMLEELRSEGERRRLRQRSSDPAEHIDEEA